MQLILNYDLKWRLKSTPNYQFTNEGICINILRGKIVKKTIVSSTIGYCINGKFRSCKSLRNELELIPIIECPF
jgi:hypothetical protein